jgi:alpha-beta hydrolase superfamily lysophospholipase
MESTIINVLRKLGIWNWFLLSHYGRNRSFGHITILCGLLVHGPDWGETMSWKNFTLSSPTGAQLNVHANFPREARAVVQINHGVAEHGARYRTFAEFLRNRDYAAVVHDHRGHGHTTAPDAQAGRLAARDGLAKVIADMAAVNAHIRERHPDLPVVVFGHSMGGILAMNYVLSHADTVDGCAIWNTNIQWSAPLSLLTRIVKVERLLKGSDVPSPIARCATFDAWNAEFKPNRTAFDWLSRDAAEVDKYVADPLCGFEVPVGTWLEIFEAIRFGADQRHWSVLPRELPFNLVAGGADPSSVHGTAIQKLGDQLSAYGLANVSVKIYPDTRHEGLNEINRTEIMTAFADWLDANIEA